MLKVEKKSFLVYILFLLLFSCNTEKEKDPEALIRKLNEKAIEISSLNNRLRDLQELSERLNQDKASLISGRDSLNFVINTLQGQLKSAIQDLESIRKQIVASGDQHILAELETQNQQLRDSVFSQKLVNFGLNESLRELVVKSQRDSLRADLYRKVFELKNELSSLNSKLKDWSRVPYLDIQLPESIGLQYQDIKDKYNQISGIPETDPVFIPIINALNDLNEEITQKEQEIIALTKELQTGFYCIFTRQDLKNLGVIKARQLVNIGNIDKNVCKQVGCSEQFIPIPHERRQKPVIVSEHPTSSYRITNQSDGVTVISIQNNRQFWSQTRYIIVELR